MNEFENKLQEFTGVKHAVGSCERNGCPTSQSALAGVRAGDEVLVPTLTFIATVNAVSYLTCLPHFADSCEYSLGIDVIKLSQYLEDTTLLTAEGCFNKILVEE